MDSAVLAFLLQDAVTNAAIYALLGISILLVFGITRVLFVPQGEFVSLGALTLASFAAGRTPPTVWLLAALALAATVVELAAVLRTVPDRSMLRTLSGLLLRWTLPAAAVCALALAVAHPRVAAQMGLPAQAVASLAIVTLLGPLIHRLVYQPLASASVLVLLVASVAVHMALAGMALVLFGPEGFRTPPFTEAALQLGELTVPGQSLWIIGSALALITALGLLFSRMRLGKALRATASNRTGAQLVGISPLRAGRVCFTLAAFIGALSGLLIGPVVTVYHDSGFMFGLKGFVAAIVGGLSSPVLTGAGALLVGLLESFASFAASSYKEVIVFTFIIPVLLWLSLRSQHLEDDEDGETGVDA